MRETKYDECLEFVKRKLGVKLYPFQEDMLKAFCEGKEIRTSRGIGRSFVAACFGKYIAYLYDKNDYSKEPDMIFPYTVAMPYDIYDNELITREKSHMTETVFSKEYLCI